MAVICDDSKPLFDNADIALLSGRAAEGIKILRPFEIADYEVKSLEFGNSQEHPSLELADLFASSACSALNRGDRFFDDIVDEHREAFGNFNIRPAADFADIRNAGALRNAYVLLLLTEASKANGGLELSEELYEQIVWLYHEPIEHLTEGEIRSGTLAR
jgi:hypothetical protein